MTFRVRLQSFSPRNRKQENEDFARLDQMTWAWKKATNFLPRTARGRNGLFFSAADFEDFLGTQP